jgi:hypothetical protein
MYHPGRGSYSCLFYHRGLDNLGQCDELDLIGFCKRNEKHTRSGNRDKTGYVFHYCPFFAVQTFGVGDCADTRDVFLFFDSHSGQPMDVSPWLSPGTEAT